MNVCKVCGCAADVEGLHKCALTGEVLSVSSSPELFTWQHRAAIEILKRRNRKDWGDAVDVTKMSDAELVKHLDHGKS